MKKLLGIVVLCLLWCNVGFAEEPNYDRKSINKNINEYGWKHKNKTMEKYGKDPMEIHTLTNKNWTLKCSIIYSYLEISTYCKIP